MKKIMSLAFVLAVVGSLAIPVVEGQGTVGRVLNRRLRRVYPRLGAPGVDPACTGAPGTPCALDDPALMPGDFLLTAGIINEPFGVLIPLGWFGTIVSESRAGFVATVRGPGLVCAGPPFALLDASARGGLVSVIGGNWQVPDLCVGFYTDGSTLPLTIRSTNILGATAAASFAGILIGDPGGVGEDTGPFVVQNNRITGGSAADLGIGAFGSGAPIDLWISSNRITTGAGLSSGIGLADLDGFTAPGRILVERNTVNGAGAAPGSAGLFLTDGPLTLGVMGARVRRNTFQNFSAAVTFGAFLDNADGTQFLANRVANNAFGIVVDPGGNSFDGAPVAAGPPVIGGTAANGNNITGTPTTQIGLLFCDGDCTGGAPNGNNLNAMGNFWGAASGPRSGSATPATCPEATGPTCLGGPGTGTGMSVNVFDPVSVAPECAAAPTVPAVTTCPIRTTANIFAGA